MKEVLDLTRLGKLSIYQILIPSADDNLPRHSHLGVVLVSQRAPAPVRIIEHDGDGGFRNPGLALLVDELLQVRGPDLLQVGDAQHEADGVEDVGLAGAVEAGDGVEEGVEARDDGPGGVGLEALQADLLDVHRARFDSIRFYGEERNRTKALTAGNDRNERDNGRAISEGLIGFFPPGFEEVGIGRAHV